MPSYYPRMKALNSKGAPSVANLPGNNALSPARIATLLNDDRFKVVDLRRPEADAILSVYSDKRSYMRFSEGTDLLRRQIADALPERLLGLETCIGLCSSVEKGWTHYFREADFSLLIRLLSALAMHVYSTQNLENKSGLQYRLSRLLGKARRFTTDHFDLLTIPEIPARKKIERNHPNTV